MVIPPRPPAGFRFCAVICLAVVLGMGRAQAQQATVRLDHPVYPFLKKGETQGLMVTYRLRHLPLTRDSVFELLESMATRRERLSRADQRLLDQLLGEFTEPGLGDPAQADAEIHAVRFEEGETQIFVDLRGLSTLEMGDDQKTISRTSAIGAIRGRVGRYFAFGLTARNTMILGEDETAENFDVNQGGIRSRVGAAGFSDQATGYLTARWGRFQFLVGRDRSAWGGIDEQLSLSDLNEPMDLIKAAVDFDRFRFTYLHGSLQGINSKRYLAGHRLDYLVSDKLQVGLYETVVYGGRGAEFGYLNPLVPYHVIEHQLGDKDNNTVGIDFNLFAAPGLRFFGETFIDDLSLDRSLASYWGNKFALLGGFHWTHPLGYKPADVTAAYVRVDPFVYSHVDSLNRYSHYGESLGSRVGPNGDRFYVNVGLQLHRDIRVNLGIRTERQGAGSLEQPHVPADGDLKRFLAGVVERTNSYSLGLRIQFKRDLFMIIDVLHRNRNNAGRLAGRRKKDNFAKLTLDINY